MRSWEAALDEIGLKQVFLGGRRIKLYASDQLELGQLGYSKSPTGASLVGVAEGDWRESWVVIGYDESGGEPIFIDICEDGYPVYTAMIGMGRWHRERVALSLAAFALSLSAIAAVAVGREYPIALERNPLSVLEKKSVLSVIGKNNFGLDLSYWEVFLDG